RLGPCRSRLPREPVRHAAHRRKDGVSARTGNRRVRVGTGADNVFHTAGRKLRGVGAARVQGNRKARGNGCSRAFKSRGHKPGSRHVPEQACRPVVRGGKACKQEAGRAGRGVEEKTASITLNAASCHHSRWDRSETSPSSL